MKKLLILIISLCLTACTSAQNYSENALVEYDKDTRYNIKETEGGFTISLLYSRYQLIPESSALVSACKSQLTAIAWEYAEMTVKEIEPINEQRIRLSIGRNGLSGITSCSAHTFVDWQQ